VKTGSIPVPASILFQLIAFRLRSDAAVRCQDVDGGTKRGEAYATAGYTVGDEKNGAGKTGKKTGRAAKDEPGGDRTASEQEA
jgi:hypothetical protein